MKTAGNEINFANLSDSSLQIPLFPSDSEIPEIQETTYQVPFGKNSILDREYKVPGFAIATYLKVIEHSNWDTGQSRYISHRFLSKELNVKSHSQVHRAIHWLIDNEWLQLLDKRDTDGTFRYQVIFYKEETPLDKDGRVRKCAVPLGKGSVNQQLTEGKITWKVFVDWIIRKISSCWQTGYLGLTVRKALELIPFSFKTLSENIKSMSETGLLEKLSRPFRASEYQLYPKPYPKRRERKKESFLPEMKQKNGWIYSLNELWKLNRETFELMMCEPAGRWRHSSFEELYYINKKIHHDFSHLMRILRARAV